MEAAVNNDGRWMMGFRAMWLSAALSVGCALSLGAQEQQRITVGGLRCEGEKAKLIAARIGGVLEAELLKQPGVRVVERKEKDQVFQEQRLQQTGATDVATAIELGKNLNVDKIIFGSVEVAAGIVHVTLKAVRVENSELAFSESDEAEAGNETAVSKACYGLVERMLTALTGRAVNVDRPSGPQRLVLVLTEGDINPAVKIPRKSGVMAVLLVDDQAVDSAVVAKRTGWGVWNARLTVPNYQSQEITVNFYVKGRDVRQYIGGHSFEIPDDGVYSIVTGDNTGAAASSRFRVLLEIE